ncbi:MAG TPA: hypothetical protein VE035_01840 [Puia sp.]|nr:hypothetical protein [Puia sp.]
MKHKPTALKKARLWLFIGPMLFFTIIATAQDSDQEARLKASTPEQRAHFQDSLMNTRLALNTTQYSQVHAINIKYARQIEPLIKSDDSRFSKYSKIKPLLEAKDKELKTVFTGEQCQKYEAVKKEMMKLL